jgi:hypothetical protein
MASPVVSTKANPKQSKTGQTSATAINDTPITEEELKKKETPINSSDVLRLRKPTNGINEKMKKRFREY